MTQLSLLEDLQIVSSLRARLLQSASYFLKCSGSTRAATLLSAQALQIALQVWLPDNINIFNIKSTATECLIKDAKYDEAESMALDCLEMLDYRNIVEQLDEQDRLLRKYIVSRDYNKSLFGQGKSEQLDRAYRTTIELGTDAGLSRQDMQISYHNLADNLVTIGRLDEARQLNDSLIEEFWASPTDTQINTTFVGGVINVRIGILEKLLELCDDLVEKENLRSQIFRFRKELFEYSLADKGIEGLNSWKMANNLLGHYVNAAKWESFFHAGNQRT